MTSEWGLGGGSDITVWLFTGAPKVMNPKVDVEKVHIGSVRARPRTDRAIGALMCLF